MTTLARGDSGREVAELQRRLRNIGFPTGDDPAAVFDGGTEAALRRFQTERGLVPDGACGQRTWNLLVEAGFSPNERLLCLVSPMVRGEDVAELQLRLGGLGFDAGKVDGIFGPKTQLALRDFQRNAGLICDDVCGPDTWEALERLESRAGQRVVADVREQERLRQIRDGLIDLRLAVGATPAGTGLAERLAQLADATGETVIVTSGTWDEQAAAANAGRSVDLVLGIDVVDEPVTRANYFEVPGYSSFGGQRLARLLVEALDQTAGLPPAVVNGTRLPLLRETRPPAVLLELGPSTVVEEHLEVLAGALLRAVEAWSGHDV